MNQSYSCIFLLNAVSLHIIIIRHRMTLSIRKFVVALISLAASVAVMAAVTDLPVTTINGKQYHYYTVQPQETVYSLCRQFNITHEELIKNNPAVQDGLKAGQLLLFPVGAGQRGSVVEHMVKRGETAYGISKLYGMSIDEFYALNPSARDGLSTGQYVVVNKSNNGKTAEAPSTSPIHNITIPSNATSVSHLSIGGKHTIQPGETLYQIARANNISLADLLAFNPSLDRDHYTAGTSINIPTVSNATAAPTATTSSTYTVREGDTLYGIAKAHHIDLAQLRAANPNVDILKEGMTLSIPQACAETTSRPETITSPVTTTSTAPIARRTSNSDALTFAIALPFTAGDSVKAGAAANAAEFLRGFMIAVDSMRNVGQPIKVLVYDVSSPAQAQKAIGDPQLRTANVIIANDGMKMGVDFSEYARENGIYLANMFAVNSKSHLTNPSVIQFNTPHETLYGKGMDYFLSRFPDAIAVVLKRKGGKNNRQEFVNNLISALQAKGRTVQEITFSDKLQSETLSKLAKGKNYVFIPLTDDTDEVKRIAPAITKFREERADDGSVNLYGYSLWLKLRGNSRKQLSSANTVIFSRFSSVEDDPDESTLRNAFTRWYGREASDLIPPQSTYGFDTGMFLIKAMNSNNGDFTRFTPTYDGIQRYFDLKRAGTSDNSGWVNDDIYIINFAPGNTFTKIGF